MSEGSIAGLAHVEILVPELGDNEKGVLLDWLSEEGSEVTAGHVIAEVETDKATLEIEAPATGQLTQRARVGDSLSAGSAIGFIGDPRRVPAEAPKRRLTPDHDPEPANTDELTEPKGQVAAAETQTSPTAFTTTRRHSASPLARRLARALDVDLGSLAGSGRNGRIVRTDVLRAADGREQMDTTNGARETPGSAPSTLAAAPDSTPSSGDQDVALSRLQTTVARRMVQAHATIPDFQVSAEVDIDAAVQTLDDLRQAGLDPLPSINDMIVRASALALREFPKVNASFHEDRLRIYARVNVGVAVASDSALLVPTIFDADKKSLAEIAVDSRRLVQRARSGSLAQQDLSSGTFTVSNLGMFGVASFTAVVNPPQAAILAVGAIAEQAVVRDGRVVPGQRMVMTLSCDHRIVYGADAAQFIAHLQALLQRPLT